MADPELSALNKSEWACADCGARKMFLLQLGGTQIACDWVAGGSLITRLKYVVLYCHQLRNFATLQLSDHG